MVTALEKAAPIEPTTFFRRPPSMHLKILD